jgi:hypothetical protein
VPWRARRESRPRTDVQLFEERHIVVMKRPIKCPLMSDADHEPVRVLSNVTSLNQAIQILLAQQRWLLSEIEANHPIDVDDLARITHDLSRALEASWNLEEELNRLLPTPPPRALM